MSAASRNERRVTLAVALAGGVVAVLAWQFPGAYRALPLLPPDAGTYIDWAPKRPPAYPAFLSMVRIVSTDFAWIGPLQFGIFVLAAACLAATFCRATQRPLLASLLGVAILNHPQVVSYSFTVLPESLLMSTTMLHIVAVTRLLLHPIGVWAALSGLTLAIAILEKPVAVAFLAGSVLVAVGLWRHPSRRVMLVTFAAGVLVPVVAATLANRARHGVMAPQSMGGYALLGVVATFFPDDTPVDPPELQRALVVELAPIRRELARIDSWTMYYIYSSHAYHEAIDRATDVILKYLDTAGAAERDREDDFVRLDRISQGLAWQTIARAPGAYARHIIAHLYGLWMMPLVRRASDQPGFAQQLDALRRELPIVARSPVLYRTVPDYAYWPFKAVLVTALAGSGLAIVLFVFRPTRVQWALPAYGGTLLHAYFLLTAAAQTGLPRYALAGWPLTALVVCGLAAAILPHRRRAT